MASLLLYVVFLRLCVLGGLEAKHHGDSVGFAPQTFPLPLHHRVYERGAKSMLDCPLGYAYSVFVKPRLNLLRGSLRPFIHFGTRWVLVVAESLETTESNFVWNCYYSVLKTEVATKFDEF